MTAPSLYQGMPSGMPTEVATKYGFSRCPQGLKPNQLSFRAARLKAVP
jgi:hypothetical protein